MADDSQLPTHPRHIGIIMDGNGRWAKERGMMRISGHRQGAETCRRIITACQELNVPYLTLYAFSSENWKRPGAEVSALMELLELFLSRETKLLVKQGVRLRAIGRIDALPDKARTALEKAMEATRHFTDWNLTLALNYSSRNELADAAKAIAADVAAGLLAPGSVDWDAIASRLYTKDLPDPDLIIRTSGEHRLSNFLLMQSAYAELFFTSAYWPDFSKEHLEEAIAVFKRRERRFGQTGDQLASAKPTGA